MKATMKAAQEVLIKYDKYTAGILVDMFYEGAKHARKKFGLVRKMNRNMLDGIITFDTETTTIILDKYKCYNSEDGTEIDVTYNKAAFINTWMFCILGKCVVYGRTTCDLQKFVEELQTIVFKDIDLTVYVHNLFYDWYFLKHLFTWSTEGSFVTGNTDFYLAKTGNVTFKDSIKYSNACLEKTVKNCPHSKAVGNWDYNKFRTPKTPLTNKELRYAINDVLSLWEYLEDVKEKHGKSIKSIPLTFTRDIKDSMIKFIEENNEGGYKKYYYSYLHNCVTSLGGNIESYAEIFLLLRKIFYGGFCETSFFRKDRLLKNVGHKDYTSDYPFQLVSRKFPVAWHKEKLYKNDVVRIMKHDATAFICNFKFKNVRSKRSFGWLPLRNIVDSDKMVKDGKIVTLHSKLYSACPKKKGDEDVEIIIPLNEIQFKTFRMVYDFDDWDIVDEECYVANKNYLPDVAREFILELFEKKTTLKGIPDLAYEYSQSKVGINGLYGVSVSNPVRLEHELTPEGDVKAYYKEKDEKGVFIKHYVEHENAEIPLEAVIKQLVKTYMSKGHPVFPYHVGVWVTSYAQNQLLEDICYLDERGDYVTSDTDSVFFTHPENYIEYFNEKNRKIVEMNEIATKNLKHTYIYKNQKGKESILGVYTDELVCKEFKALRSKTYLAGFSKDDFDEEELKKDKTLVLNKKTGLVYQATVCGISKMNLIQYFNEISAKKKITIMEQFNETMSVPADRTGKLVGKTYELKKPITIIFDDGYRLKGLQSYIVLEETPFKSLPSFEQVILDEQSDYNEIKMD